MTAFISTCPRSARSKGPVRGPSFASLARRRITLRSPGTAAIDSDGGDPQVGAQIDPATGSGDACIPVSADRAPGTAVVTRRVREGRAVTLIGAAKIRAALSISGSPPANTQIAGRLWDVAPDGETQTLVARGSFRPARQGAAKWYLHPAAWRFKAGHTIKLELLGADAPYSRPSNGTFSTEITRLRVRLPVR